jgi:RHS repeat-associated protein
LQGTGGFEATIVDAGALTKGVINDHFGNGVASVSSNTLTWFGTRVSGYGPLPGTAAETLTDVTRVAEATAWRGRRIDPTGFYNLGARYYEPTSGRFLSADPKGHRASPSLYDFCNGDGVNNFDPDGREHVQEPGFTKPLTGANVGNMWGTFADAGLLSPRTYIDSYRDAGMLPSGVRAEGVYTMVIGAGATVGGVLALTPAGEVPSGGTSTVAGITGIVTGIPTFWAGFVQTITGEDVPKSPGDIFAKATKNESLGTMVDLSLLLIDPEALANAKNLADLIGQVDAGKTVVDAAQKAMQGPEAQKTDGGAKCSPKK